METVNDQCIISLIEQKGLTDYQGNKDVLDHGVQMSLIKGEVT